MADTPNPVHLQAYFRVIPPAAGLPKRFGIVTAYNPGGKTQDAAANLAADNRLAADLMACRLPHFRVTGGDKAFAHSEPGWGIVASIETIRSISRKFKQEAFYWVSEELIFVVNTGGKTLHPVGRWAERRAI